MPLREIPGPAGRLEALLDEPRDARSVDAEGLVHAGHAQGVRAAVVFGHPHPAGGGTMHTKVVYQAAKALARTGSAVLRFNFRGAGASAGSFAGDRGAVEDFRSGLDFMSRRFPGSRLWTAGMSFGSWVSMTVGAQDPRVSTLVGISCPISKYDWEQVCLCTKPKFFIHGERDEVASLRDIREFYARAAEPKELVVIDGADHLFDGKVGDVADAVEDLLGDWSG